MMKRFLVNSIALRAIHEEKNIKAKKPDIYDFPYVAKVHLRKGKFSLTILGRLEVNDQEQQVKLFTLSPLALQAAGELMSNIIGWTPSSLVAPPEPTILNRANGARLICYAASAQRVRDFGVLQKMAEQCLNADRVEAEWWAMKISPPGPYTRRAARALRVLLGG